MTAKPYESTSRYPKWVARAAVQKLHDADPAAFALMSNRRIAVACRVTEITVRRWKNDHGIPQLRPHYGDGIPQSDPVDPPKRRRAKKKKKGKK